MRTYAKYWLAPFCLPYTAAEPSPRVCSGPSTCLYPTCVVHARFPWSGTAGDAGKLSIEISSLTCSGDE